MRLRSLKNFEQRIENTKEFFVVEAGKYKGRWRDYFHNDNPIYLEIGMGKGQFIRQQALLHEDINFIGLEKEIVVLVKASERMERKLDNLVFINGDATNLLSIFSPGEISKIYLNFSDPWPKKRHIKRRLVSPSYLDIYRVINQGSIEFKTDNRSLFTYSIMSFNNFAYKIVDLSLDLHADKENIITTEYEERFLKEGKPIYFIEVENEKHGII